MKINPISKIAFRSKRVRSKAYIKTLQGKPCLVCKQEAEAHHVRFAEPSAMGMKVGDNWCVPLCHTCHMQLHAFGDERTWWDLQGIEPLKWAKKSWESYIEK